MRAADAPLMGVVPASQRITVCLLTPRRSAPVVWFKLLLSSRR